MSHGPQKVLVGVTGSIAAVKAPELVRLFKDHGFDVRCVMTPAAREFVSPMALSAFCGEKVICDMFGPDAYTIPHVKLSEEAALMVIAPASASNLAHLAHGISDDLVSLSYLTTSAPVLVAPAMHTPMWEHAATQANVKILKDRGVHFVGPYQGPLADLTRGEGRMAEPEEIVKVAESILLKKKS